MSRSLHTVVESPEFQRRIRRVLTDAERNALIDQLAAHPDAGEIMVGTGVARKLRWGTKGSGKSGGIRVITFFSGPPVPAFLLTAFGKGERINLTKAERNTLRSVLAELVTEYRRGIRSNVKGR